jgi:hypothetical protein
MPTVSEPAGASESASVRELRQERDVVKSCSRVQLQVD